MLMGSTGHCRNCGTTYFGRFNGRSRHMPDRGFPMRCKSCLGARDEVSVNDSWRPNTGLKMGGFYCEGHQVFQAPGMPTVYSRGEEQRVLESCGISPEDGLTPLKDDAGNDIF